MVPESAESLRRATTAPPDDITDIDEPSGSMKMVLESQRIALGDIPPEWKVPVQRDRKHKWAAIVLALVLGGLLAAGIAFVASQGRDAETPPDSAAAPE